jgi:MGT family glycosyltransferase
LKALFFSLPLHGHIIPTLPLVRELAGRGERIVYYSTPTFAAKIGQAGAEYRPYRNAFLQELQQLPERMEELSGLLMTATADLLNGELDAWRAERPDYLITDSVAAWGQWTAKLLRVPVVTSVPTLAVNRHVLRYAFSHGVRPRSASRFLSKLRYMVKASLLRRRLVRRHGVSGPGIMGLVSGCSGLNIVYGSRHFQPCASTFDERFLFIGPSSEPRGASVPFPWELVTHPVVVYVSLGTLFNTDADFYRKCYEAFRGEDYQVILSSSMNVDLADLGPAPPNFIAQAHVPQIEVLRRATAFVSHGGMNSVNESLSHGVPMLVIPQMGEQMIIGRRVEELGAGLYIEKPEVTAEKLREGVRRLLADQRFREQAVRVRQSFQTAGGVVRAADAIRAFTR